MHSSLFVCFGDTKIGTMATKSKQKSGYCMNYMGLCMKLQEKGGESVLQINSEQAY